MQNLNLLGISHNTAPVEIREKLSISDSKFFDILASIKKIPGVSECVLISTCNRVEVYLNTENGADTISELISFLSKQGNLNRSDLSKYLYKISGVEVAEHVMRVAAGLDSMMLGENQILGQLKAAHKKSAAAKFTGPILNTLFNRAVSAGKRARAETGISQGPASISAAAVELAGKIFEDLTQHQVLIIGAGKMSELAARQLICYGVKSVLVSNRTFNKAKEIALKFDGIAIRFDEIKNYLAKVDIVISSSGAPHYLLKKEDLAQIVSRRSGRPLFFIDVAVPRDIDPEIGSLENVFLYDIDDLGAAVEENKKERAGKIPKVEKIIEEEKKKFLAWYAARNKHKTEGGER